MKIGPGRNSNVASRWFQIDEPVTSDGSRSGVNWTREKRSPVTSANDRAVSVFASPGTSSSRTCPSASMPARTSSSRSRLPTTARSTSSRIAPRAGRRPRSAPREPFQVVDRALDRRDGDARVPCGRRAPGDPAARAPRRSARAAPPPCPGGARGRLRAGAGDPSRSVRRSGRRRKWTSKAVPVASATSRSTRARVAGRARAGRAGANAASKREARLGTSRRSRPSARPSASASTTTSQTCPMSAACSGAPISATTAQKLAITPAAMVRSTRLTRPLRRARPCARRRQPRARPAPVRARRSPRPSSRDAHRAPRSAPTRRER